MTFNMSHHQTSRTVSPRQTVSSHRREETNKTLQFYLVKVMYFKDLVLDGYIHRFAYTRCPGPSFPAVSETFQLQLQVFTAGNNTYSQ